MCVSVFFFGVVNILLENEGIMVVLVQITDARCCSIIEKTQVRWEFMEKGGEKLRLLRNRCTREDPFVVV